MKPSSIGISSVVEPSWIVKRRSWSRPARRSVSRPSAGANGAITSTRATSPAAYCLRSGTSVTSSCSRSRRGGTRPPATQTRSSLSFARPAASWMRALMRQTPPSFATKRTRAGASVDCSGWSWASFGTCVHSPSTCSQSSRSACSAIGRPAIASPSRSVTMASIVIGSPFCTKGFSARRPT